MASHVHGGSARSSRRRHIRELLENGTSHEEIARRLGIHPSLAYLIATGLPAEGSDARVAESHRGRPTSSQHLSNPAAGNPKASASVHRWIGDRLEADNAKRQAPTPRRSTDREQRQDSGQGDIADVLTDAHEGMAGHVEQLATISEAVDGTGARREARSWALETMAADLDFHDVVAEVHLLPLVRKVLPDGEHLADAALQQQKDRERILAALASPDLTDGDFDVLVRDLRDALRTHAALTGRLFIELRTVATSEQLNIPGASAGAMENDRSVPTGPRTLGAAPTVEGEE